MAAKSKLKIVKEQKKSKPASWAKDPILSDESKRKVLNSISIKITVNKEKIKVTLSKYMSEVKNYESKTTREEVFTSQNTASEISDLSPLADAVSGEFNTVSLLSEFGGSNVPDESV